MTSASFDDSQSTTRRRVVRLCTCGPAWSYVRKQGGHFVELKKNRLGEGRKRIPQLPWDAVIGKGESRRRHHHLNYDGVRKSKTVIETVGIFGSDTH